MNIILFGKLKDVITTLPSFKEGLTLQALKEQLYHSYPKLKDIPMAVAINQQIVHDDDIMLSSNDEIALMPPFSGG